MRKLLSFVLSSVIPIEVLLCAKVNTKQSRVDVLPEGVAGLAAIAKSKHAADVTHVKVVEPVVFLHSKNR